MKNINNISIYSESSIIEAMDKMTKSSSKTLLVIDKKKKLIGVLTDGDIRRYILSGNGLDSSIANAFNQEPFILTEDNLNHKKNSKLLFKKYNIDTIPIIDPS